MVIVIDICEMSHPSSNYFFLSDVKLSFLYNCFSQIIHFPLLNTTAISSRTDIIFLVIWSALILEIFHILPFIPPQNFLHFHSILTYYLIKVLSILVAQNVICLKPALQLNYKQSVIKTNNFKIEKIIYEF